MSPDTLPTIHVEGGVRQALDPRALGALDGGALVPFLAQRRWFGAKGHAPRAARITAIVPLPWDGGAFAVTELSVDLGPFGVATYQLPLAVREGEVSSDELRARLSALGGRQGGRAAVPTAILARVQSGEECGILFDATEDPVFRRELGAAFGTGASFAGEGVRWTITPLPDAQPGITLEMPAALGEAEQSNTSIRYDDTAILKLFRRLQPGIQPDVEVSAFLTRAGFPNTPALLGTAQFEFSATERRAPSAEHAVGRSAESVAPTTAAMLQRLVPHARDAWSWALEAARPYFVAPASEDRAPAAFVADAESLGRVTRRMHDALASDDEDPDFAPEAATEQDVERWAAQARRSIDEGLDLLQRRLGEQGAAGAAGAMSAERRAEAEALVGRRAAFHARVAEIVDEVEGDAGELIRTHGDYHLGQVLRAPDGAFFVIDFEGEPARPLEERREKRSALRDVAGMLRSFAYVAATLTVEASQRRLEQRVVEVRAARWERAVREAFLRGYAEGTALSALGARLSAPAHPDASGGGAARPSAEYLPGTRRQIDDLITLFEIEKTFYELAYELNNRPDWVWIPMRGAARVL